MSLERDWRQYLINEEIEKDIFMYLQSLQENLARISPKSMADKRRLAMARQNVKEVRKHTRRMQNRVDLLEEKLTILEEALNENEEK
jgi:hypothetical protein